MRAKCDAGAHGPRLSRAVLAASGQATADSAKNPLAGRLRGSAAAPVTVYEMSDFQCPYCRDFATQHLSRGGLRLRRDRQGALGLRQLSAHQHPPQRRGRRRSRPVRRAAERVLAGARPALPHQDVWAPLKEPAAFFLTLADSAKLSKPALLACCSRQPRRRHSSGCARAPSARAPTARRRSTSRAACWWARSRCRSSGRCWTRF